MAGETHTLIITFGDPGVGEVESRSLPVRRVDGGEVFGNGPDAQFVAPLIDDTDYSECPKVAYLPIGRLTNLRLYSLSQPVTGGEQ